MVEGVTRGKISFFFFQILTMSRENKTKFSLLTLSIVNGKPVTLRVVWYVTPLKDCNNQHVNRKKAQINIIIIIITLSLSVPFEFMKRGVSSRETNFARVLARFSRFTSPSLKLVVEADMSSTEKRVKIAKDSFECFYHFSIGFDV